MISNSEIAYRAYPKDMTHFIDIEYYKTFGNFQQKNTIRFSLGQEEGEKAFETLKQDLKRNLGVKFKKVLLQTKINNLESEQHHEGIDNIQLQKVYTCIEIFTQFKESFFELDSIEIANFSTHNNLIRPILQWIHSLHSLKFLKVKSITPFSIELFDSLEKSVLSQDKTIETVILHFELAQQLTRETNERQSKVMISIQKLNLLSDKNLRLLDYLNTFNTIAELELFITDQQIDQTLKAVQKQEKKLRKLTINYQKDLISQEDFSQLSKFRYLPSLEIKSYLPQQKIIQLFELPPYLQSLSLTLNSPVEFLNAVTKILPSLTSLEVSSYLSTNHLPLNFAQFPNLTSLSLTYNPLTQGKILQIIQADFINMQPIVSKLEYLSFNLDFNPENRDFFSSTTISQISNIISRTNNSCIINIGINPDKLYIISLLQLASSLVHLNNVENQLTIHNQAFKDLQTVFKNKSTINIKEAKHSFFLCLLAKKSKWFQKKNIFIDLSGFTPNIDLNVFKKLNLQSIFQGIIYLSIYVDRSGFIKFNPKQEQNVFDSLGMLQYPDEIKSVSFQQSIPINFLKESVTGWKNLRKIKLYNFDEIHKQPEFSNQLEEFLAGCKALSGPKFCLELYLGMTFTSIQNIIPLFSMQNNFLQIVCEGGNFYSWDYVSILQFILNSNFRFTGYFEILFYKAVVYKSSQVVQLINRYSQEINFQQLATIAFESAYRQFLPVHPASVFADLRFD